MFITEERSNYDRVLAELLEIASMTGAFANAPLLGGGIDGDAAIIPLFGIDCHVRPDCVCRNGRKLDTIGSILAVRYLLQAGNGGITNVWLPYRDLKDGAQFSHYIKAHIEDRIAEGFAGQKVLLRERLEELNGTAWSGGPESSGGIQSDIAHVVYPLPMLPVLCLFTDRDEEFPAFFQFLFDSSACSYLDLEALAAALQYIYIKITEE